MNLIYEPSVFLIAATAIRDDGLKDFLAAEGVGDWASDSAVDAEILSELAGRLCYHSYARPRPGGNAAYLKHIKECSHGSVIEHASYSFVLTGVSRSLTHELIRHRSGASYSQLSQRYVNESVSNFVVPPDLQEEVRAAENYMKKLYVDEFDGNDVTGEMLDVRAYYDNVIDDGSGDPFTLPVFSGLNWIQGVLLEQERYVRLSDYQTRKAERLGLSGTDARKFARQSARSVLPNATETKIVFTANVRLLRHFLEQRGSRFADPEIRTVANAIHAILEKESPNLFSDYTKELLPDGTYEINTHHRKV